MEFRFVLGISVCEIKRRIVCACFVRLHLHPARGLFLAFGFVWVARLDARTSPSDFACTVPAHACLARFTVSYLSYYTDTYAFSFSFDQGVATLCVSPQTFTTAGSRQPVVGACICVCVCVFVFVCMFNCICK
jgi:hypothetical protein